MNLTNAQITTLKADMQSNPALTAYFTAANSQAIADYYNTASTFIVWRTDVTPTEIMNNSAFSWSAVAGLVAGNARIWEWMTRMDYLNASNSNIRNAFATAFSGQTAMLNGITTLCQRAASNLEKLFSTGTGTAGSPGIMAVEGDITELEIRKLLWKDNGTRA